MLTNLELKAGLDTRKLELKLLSIAKHASGLAEELREIDKLKICECGSSKMTLVDLLSSGDVYKCEHCNKKVVFEKEK